MRFRVVALRAILHTPHPVPLATLTSATCFTTAESRLVAHSPRLEDQVAGSCCTESISCDNIGSVALIVSGCFRVGGRYFSIILSSGCIYMI